MNDRTSKSNPDVASAQVKPVAQVNSVTKLEQAMAGASVASNVTNKTPRPGTGKAGKGEGFESPSAPVPAKPVAQQKPNASQPSGASQKPAAPVASRRAAPVGSAKEQDAVITTYNSTPKPQNVEGMNTMVDVKTTPVSAAADSISDGAAKAQDAFRNNAREATERGQAALNEINARTRAATEKGQKLFEEVAEFQKGNFEALVASGRIAAKGAEELARTQTEAARRNLEKANENFRTLAAAKSPTEFFRLQSEIAKASLDQAVADFAKSSETYVKLMNDIAQPLSNRYAIAMDKTKTSFKA